MDASKREQRTHGTAAFPFQIYPRGENDSLFIPYHWHPELEIINIVSGKVELTIADNQYIGYEGDIFFVHSEQLHEIRGGAEGSFRAYVFPLDLLEFQRMDMVQTELLSPLAAKKLAFITELRANSSGCAAIRQALNIVQQAYSLGGTGHLLMVKAALLQIVAISEINGILQHKVQIGGDYRTQTLKSIVEYLSEHFKEQLRLNDVASRFGLSPQYFCTYFKDNLGKTLIQHINSLRIDEASRLLRETDEPIMEIAFSVGFENFSYFIKRFREIMGCTPSQYRKRMHKKFD